MTDVIYGRTPLRTSSTAEETLRTTEVSMPDSRAFHNAIMIDDLGFEIVCVAVLICDFHVTASWFVLKAKFGSRLNTSSNCKMLSARPAGLLLDTERGISTRTPGRALSKTRNVLQENATRNVPMTVMGKGRKLLQNTPLQSRTLRKCTIRPSISYLTSIIRNRSCIERPPWQAGSF